MLYGMTMIAVSGRIRRPFNRHLGRSSNRTLGRCAESGDNPVHELVYERWTTTEILGIVKKFGGKPWGFEIPS